MGKLQRLAELAIHVAAPSSSTIYAGFVGHHNLGDEVLWDLIREAFAPLKLLSAPPRSSSFKNRIIDSRRYQRVILGGGTLIGDNLPDGSNPFRDQFEWFRSKASRAAAFGTGVGKLSDLPAKNLWLQEWKPLLEGLDYIGVRGPQSVESLASIGIEAEMLGDPACLISQEPGFWTPPKRRAKVLGINLGPFEAAGLPREQNLVKALSRIVADRTAEGWQVEFFAVTPLDLVLIEQVISGSEVAGCKIHTIYESGQRYLDVVKHVSVFLGVKLHSVILAMCAGVPSLMISYAPKCNDFMNSAGMSEFTLEMADVSPQSVNSQIEALMTSADRLSAHIASEMGRFRTLQRTRAAMLAAQFSQSR